MERLFSEKWDRLLLIFFLPFILYFINLNSYKPNKQLPFFHWVLNACSLWTAQDTLTFLDTFILISYSFHVEWLSYYSYIFIMQRKQTCWQYNEHCDKKLCFLVGKQKQRLFSAKCIWLDFDWTKQNSDGWCVPSW